MEKPTKKPMKEGSAEILIEAQLDILLGGKPGDSIYRQESRGQQQLVMSNSIPVWGRMCDDPEADDAILCEMGFEVGEPFEDDPLFRPVKLPEGWTKAGTGHAMHSDIIDTEGFQRVGMFYKAAFYDRKATAHIKRRVSYGYDPRQDYADLTVSKWAVLAAAPGEVVIIIAAFECPGPEKSGGYFSPAGKEAEYKAKAYVEEHYPDFMNPLAYWNEDIKGEHFIRKHP